MTLGMYIGITGTLIFCTVGIVSQLWSINAKLAELLKLKQQADYQCKIQNLKPPSTGSGIK